MAAINFFLDQHISTGVPENIRCKKKFLASTGGKCFRGVNLLLVTTVVWLVGHGLAY